MTFWYNNNDVDLDKDIDVSLEADFDYYVDVNYDLETDVNVDYCVDVDIDSNYAELIADVQAVGTNTSVTVETSVLTMENELSHVSISATSAVG